jgi:hypothetical protein
MTFDRIVDKLRRWGRPWTEGSEPLELHRAILEEVEAQVVAVGGGRRVFPADRIEVRLLAATAEEEARLEAIVRAGWELEREVRERLAAAGARVPEDLAIEVVVTCQGGPEFGDRRWCVIFRKAAPAAEEGAPASLPTARLGAEGASASAPAAPSGAESGAARPAASPAARTPVLRLAVLKGRAACASYELCGERIYLGRLDEVLDPAGRVKRRNDVAFVEEGEVNQTVSREHARIAWDAETKAFWLRDEGSASGTMLFRAGRSIEVSRHDRRGVRLADGDEIYLGRAALRVGL